MAFQEVPDDSEVWLMSGKTKHDEISIGSTKHMLRVGIMVRGSSLLSEKWEINVMHLARCLPDEVHDFVLSFSRNIGIREDHLDILPTSIIVQAVLEIKFKLKRRVRFE